MTAQAACSSPVCRALAPIVVGGNGGSGTRVVAEILRQAGVYIGSDLNAASDNLTFTYVFKHPYRYSPSPEKLAAEQPRLFGLYEGLFYGRMPSRFDDWKLFLRCARDHALHRYKPAWVLARSEKAIRAPKDHRCLWGWKEPNSMYFTEGLKDFYPQAKYIHLIRHGLDMVYTRNDQQYEYWRPTFGMDTSDDSDQAHFEFWYRSNKRAYDDGSRLFGENFYLIRFEDLVLSPKETIVRLLDFVQPPTQPDLSKLAKIPQVPKTYQRYKEHDLAWIDDRVRDQLAFFGFNLSSGADLP